MAIDSIAALLSRAEESGLPLWEVILQEDLAEGQSSREDSLKQMTRLWEAMKESGDAYRPEERSRSGLSGGDSAKVQAAMEGGTLYGGRFFQEVIAQALRISECNACMKRIVAAPTAGSCGVLPAVLLPLLRQGESEEEILHALYVAAGFGEVIATRASISGAEGGCQAEIGSASAMAAAALTQLRGGTPAMCAHACAMALSNLMGLVCDPVAGLVEVPCIHRNVVGAVNALSCADMALSGVECRIPADEVIDAMARVGTEMDDSLRETGEGGLAATPTGKAIAERLAAEG